MPDTTIPAEVSLMGINCAVRVVENMVMFSDTDRCGCYIRLLFERRCGCWYVAVDSSTGSAPVSHIEEAARLVAEWFGADFGGKNGENRL